MSTASAFYFMGKICPQSGLSTAEVPLNSASDAEPAFPWFPSRTARCALLPGHRGAATRNGAGGHREDAQPCTRGTSSRTRSELLGVAGYLAL